MIITIDEHYAHFDQKAAPMEVDVLLEHTETEHVFVGTHPSVDRRIFEVKLLKGNGLEGNTRIFEQWLDGTCFRLRSRA